jgi:hypothetical protein
MAEVIRVTRGDGWFYVAAGSKSHGKLASMTAAGLAETHGHEVRLVSETGPMDWDELSSPDRHRPAPLAALAAMDPNGIRINPGESIRIGKDPDAASYNEFADISLVTEAKSPGLALSSAGLTDGEIVVTVWPKEKRIVPAKVVASGARLWVELAEPQPKGSRCFVADDHGRSLATVSLQSDGSGLVAVLPPVALDSWLFAAGSRATKSRNDRYSLSSLSNGQAFVVTDNKTGRRYAGKFKNNPTCNPERFSLESERVKWLLSFRGLAGILPNYQLAKEC